MEPSRKGREGGEGSLGAGGCDEDERTKKGDHQNFFSPERLLAAGRRRSVGMGLPNFKTQVQAGMRGGL